MRVIRVSVGSPTLLQEGVRMLQALQYPMEGIQSTKLRLRDLPLSTSGVSDALQVL